MNWIYNHPEATRLDCVKALAYSLIGTADDPNDAQLEYYGLPEYWTITDEPMETCLAFDDIVMRCEVCDWWCATEDLEDDVCSECR